MDGAQWTQPQEIGVAKSMATISPSASECTRTTVMERKVRPQKDQALNCPRCHSTNTKFCYYNNYSLTQPRYFCKSCRRYWTEGGTLRNVPVGGGSRKNKKSNSIISPSLSMATASVSSSQKLPDLNPPSFSSQTHKSHDHQAQDLNLGFQAPQDYYHGIPQFLEFPKIENRNVINSSSSSSSSSSFSTPLSAINLLRNGVAVRGLMNSSIPMAPETNALFASGFQFQECKPSSLAFSFDGFHGNSGSTYSHIENNINESLVFPFGTTKRHSSMSTTEADDQSIKGHENSNSNGYNWNGMLG